jgi:hypothetical protein
MSDTDMDNLTLSLTLSRRFSSLQRLNRFKESKCQAFSSTLYTHCVQNVGIWVAVHKHTARTSRFFETLLHLNT